MREYAEHGEVHERLAGLLAAAAGKTFRLVFQPSSTEALRAQQFDGVCELVLAAGELTFVAEELRFITRPNWAPLAWAKVTMTGRHDGLTVIGTSQRPASVDKDFLGNCTLVRSGRLVYPEDARAVARVMQIEEAQILSLPPLAWIERDTQSGALTRGRLGLSAAAGRRNMRNTATKAAHDPDRSHESGAGSAVRGAVPAREDHQE